MMKNVFAVILGAVLLTSCTSPNAVPWDTIEVKEETNSQYLGSYQFERCSGYGRNRTCWPEWGDWSSDFELTFDLSRNICFGGFNQGTVKSQPGYHWVEKNFRGRICIRLEKE